MKAINNRPISLNYFRKNNHFYFFFKYRPIPSWNIEKHFFKGDENDLKVAIIEADKLLEEALREAGIRGASLGDRLKNIKQGQLPNIDDVWQAHRLRNDIVHQPTFKLKRDLAERSLAIYEETLRALHLLD